MFLMNFAGLPAHIWLAGTGFVTTEPAPMMEFFPMCTPLSRMLCAPMNAFSSITTGLHTLCLVSSAEALITGFSEWKSVVYTQTPPPILTLF